MPTIHLWQIAAGLGVGAFLGAVFYGIVCQFGRKKGEGFQTSQLGKEATAIVAVLIVLCGAAITIVGLVMYAPSSGPQNHSAAAQRQLIQSSLAQLRTELTTLDSSAEFLIEGARKALDFSIDMPLDDGPWKCRDNITHILRRFDKMIPPERLDDLVNGKKKLDHSFAEYEAAPDILKPAIAHTIKVRFLKEREVAEPKVTAAIEDWKSLSSAVNQFCGIVDEYLKRGVDLDVVTKAHSNAIEAFDKRVANDTERPQLHKLLNTTFTECQKLATLQ